MKKLVLLAITGMAAMNLVVAGPAASEADQKWLAAVEKMVAKGEKSISTPVEARTQLAKDWAKKNGYSVAVTKIGSSYRLEFSKALAKS
jgi:hypothetical protein